MTKVLIADDEVEVRNVIKVILSSKGYEVVEATDGEDTLTAAAKEMPDLILLDIMMPIMNGFDVLEKLKSDAKTQSIPVIIVSALTEPQDEQMGMRNGALDFITKPWAPGELEDRILLALPHLEPPSGEESNGPSSENTPDSGDSEFYPGLVSATSNAISTGSDPIDRALMGGIPHGSLTLLEGATGTGKSVICQHLAYGALLAEQGVAFYIQGISADDLVANMKSLGLDVAPNLREGQLNIHSLDDHRHGGFRSLLDHLKGLPWDMNVIVLDPLTQMVNKAGFAESLEFFIECQTLCRLGKAILISLHTSSFDPEALGRLNSLFGTHLSLRIEGFTQGVQLKTMNVLDVNKVKGTRTKGTSSIFFEVDTDLGRSMNMSLKVLPMFRVKG